MFFVCFSGLKVAPQSATEPDDFTAENLVHELTLQCGTHYVNISVIDDTVSEPDEVFVLELNGTDVGDGSRIVYVTIVDDDRK